VIPNIGQEFLFHGFRFKILRRQRNQITQVRVWKVEASVEQPVAESA
jgi:Mg2+/Co2+ transporter CorB